MSGLAKVFLVINLVLAIIFLGTSATLFSVRKDFKKESADLTEFYKKNFDKQKQDIEKLAAKAETWAYVISVQNAEITNANAAKIELARKLGDAEAQLKTATTELETKKANIDVLTSEVAQQSTQLTGLVTRITQSQELLTKTVDERRKAIELSNETVLQKAVADEKIVALETENTALRDENGILKTQLTLAMAGGGGKELGPTGNPQIAAKVLSVKEKLVILSVGSDDKVAEGMVFIVYRDGKYLGDVKIVNVYKDMAGAEVVHTVSGAEIKEGDDAKTKQLL